MSRKFFGTDGVRGRVGTPPITPEFALGLAQATGRVLKRKFPNEEITVFIGKDTRVSGYMLESALQAGFLSAGINVYLGGPLPTPAVAYLTRALRLTMGVVISASHNPYYDNGIKFFSAAGRKLPDELEEEIEQEMEKGYDCVESASLGKAKRIDDAAGRYIEFCKSTISTDVDLKGMKIYVDASNGAAYHIAPDVYHELGASVVADADEPDGFNINENVGATHTETLPQRVAASGCDLGVAFDGDADRLIMADHERVYNGDELLYLIARCRMAKRGLKGVVGTLMTNYAVEKRFHQLDIPFFRAKVGDRYVLELLQEKGLELGGEGSGHIIVLDKQTTGDGIVTSLQVLSALKRSKKTLSEYLSDLTLSPQVLINRRFAPGYKWEEDESLKEEVAKAEELLKGRGRVLIRASGTEPLIRVMVEADDHELAQGLAQKIADHITE